MNCICKEYKGFNDLADFDDMLEELGTTFISDDNETQWIFKLRLYRDPILYKNLSKDDNLLPALYVRNPELEEISTKIHYQTWKIARELYPLDNKKAMEYNKKFFTGMIQQYLIYCYLELSLNVPYRYHHHLFQGACALWIITVTVESFLELQGS